MAIRAGVHDTCLVVGVEKMSGAGMLGGFEPETIHTEGLLGSGLMPSIFAELGNAHSERYGTTFEQFAKVAVKNHEHATRNPLARYRSETPLDVVMGAEMIASPNTKLMCSANVDGAAAVVLVSERKQAETTRRPTRSAGPRVRAGHRPVHRPQPDFAGLRHLHHASGRASLRDGRAGPRGHGLGGAA